MNKSYKASAVAVAVLAIFSATASATPIGVFSITNIATGAVDVSAGRIDWFPPSNPVGGPPGYGDIAFGAPTEINYDGGTVDLSGGDRFGQIQDIDVGAGPIADFLRIYTSTVGSPLMDFPAFDLLQVSAGGSNQGALNNCDGVTAVGVSCSPFVALGPGFVSPFVLTNRGNVTDVSLSIVMRGRDSSGEATWTGGFTTQVITQDGVRLTPDAIQDLINAGGVITNTYSGTFTGSAAIPEPVVLALMGTGFAVFGLVLRRRRKQ
jgi:hypothetical protein